MTEEKDFNFAEAEETSEEVQSIEEAFDELKIDKEILEEKLSSQGKVTAKIIAEARELAATKTGLDIDWFMKKHQLINIDLEQLLHAPLKEDGTYA